MKEKGWQKIYHENIKHQKAVVAIVISDKADIKFKNVIKYKEKHFVIIKKSNRQENSNVECE